MGENRDQHGIIFRRHSTLLTLLDTSNLYALSPTLRTAPQQAFLLLQQEFILIYVLTVN
jgi:hypothetical protein